MGIRLHRPRVSDSTDITSSSGSVASMASSMSGDMVRMSKSVKASTGLDSTTCTKSELVAST